MEDTQRVGVGTVVMRNKQYLAAIRPLDGALAMSTMRFADEVVPQSAVDQLPDGSARVDPKELKLASQIIDSLATEWDPERYHDTYTEELKDLIERKAKGEDIVREEAPAARTNVIDLMAALEASLAAAKKAGSGDVAKEVARTADRLAEEADEAEHGDDEGGEATSGRTSAGTATKKKAPARKRTSKSAGATSTAKTTSAGNSPATKTAKKTAAKTAKSGADSTGRTAPAGKSA